MKPSIILGRDGVINEYKGDFIASTADWQPIPGSLEAIAALSRAGYEIVIISNQSSVGGGRLVVSELDQIHQLIGKKVEQLGGTIAGIFYCPHTEDADCVCRLPRTGLLDRIEKQFGINLKDVPLVGDSIKDLQVARAKQCKPILVRTGNGTQTEATTLLWPKYGVDTMIFDDLAAFAHSLIHF